MQSSLNALIEAGSVSPARIIPRRVPARSYPSQFLEKAPDHHDLAREKTQLFLVLNFTLHVISLRA